MSDEVEKLWELQTLLSQLGEREKQMALKPESFAAIDREHQAANDEMAAMDQSLEQLGKERRRVEGELSDQQELLKKYQGQLMQVKNQQQYAAAWKEIDTTRKHVKELEESALKTMTDMDAVQTQLDARKAGYTEIKGRYDAAHDAWQQSLGTLRGEVETLRKKVAEVERHIPERLRNEFYKIFKQRQGIGVAPVTNDSCSACRSRVRPALYQQLKRGELVFCEGCRRILYVEKQAS